VKKWPLGELFRLDRAAGTLTERIIALILYAVARAFVKVAMFIRLSAITPKPTQRCMPSTP
jgi:hypothetical protein